jgi:predicted DNA-binding helix-hairpin-helix protein
MKSVNLAISFIKFEALQWSWKDLVSESSLYRCKVFHNRNKKNIMLLLILVIFTRQEVAKINITLFNREYIST